MYHKDMDLLNALKNMKWWGWVILVFLLITAIGQCGTNSTKPDPKPTPTEAQKIEEAPAPIASYSAELLNYQIINPASIDVFYTVTNTNGIGGTADCKINVSDASGTYRGYDIVSIPIGPNETSKNATTIVVTNEGASYVTEGSVVCQGK